MTRFLDEDFLLSTRAAQKLYHECAEDMPVFDYHCHLPARRIAQNVGFSDITEAWLEGDHYKWRAMRMSGVSERLITGDAAPREKFRAWAEVVPATIGNPLYHWTHLELKRYFGVEKLLGPGTAEEIFDICSSMLSQREFHARGLLERMNVRVVCTTDDPTDGLEHHEAILAGRLGVTVVPTFRPDAALELDDPAAFNPWVDRLERAAGVEIGNFKDFLDALARRHEFFHGHGCRASDHGLDVPYAEEYTEAGAEKAFAAARGGKTVDWRDALAFKSAVMTELARMDAEKKWVQQIHVGALRNVNSRFRRNLGANTGFDTIGDAPFAASLTRFLDRLDAEGSLPKTILFCLNPAANAVLVTVSGCYPEEGVKGKVQIGPAWWFNDQKRGMEEQMSTLADMGLLSRFVGMVTDSRSFLSFPRHEYFRRILCNLLGGWMESGEIPRDFDLVGGMVRDVCFNNAEEYFALPAARISSAESRTPRSPHGSTAARDA
jgi:glucuronate isomerase